MKLIKKVSRKIFPIYTKTFGGKIWIDLHSVSPSNFSGKNFNEVSFKSTANNYSNSISCKN